MANQFATGLALALFGGGIASFIGLGLQGETLPPRELDGVGFLRDLPLSVRPFLPSTGSSTHRWCERCGGWFLFRTRADWCCARWASRRSPRICWDTGSASAGPRWHLEAPARLAGAYLATIYTPLWSEGVVAGRGWIALALVTFATCSPRVYCSARICLAV